MASQTEGNAQLEGLFLSSLLLQIQKVNAFYQDKAHELGQHLERCAHAALSRLQCSGSDGPILPHRLCPFFLVRRVARVDGEVRRAALC